MAASGNETNKLLLNGDGLTLEELNTFSNPKKVANDNSFIDSNALLTYLCGRYESKNHAARLVIPSVAKNENISDDGWLGWAQRVASEWFAWVTASLLAQNKINQQFVEKFAAIDDRIQHLKLEIGRINVNFATHDLNERLVKTQIYKHIEVLIAFRMAAPVSLTGLMMFIIEASLGDIDFSSESVQTTLSIGAYASLIGVLGAAYFIKSILHQDWIEEANDKLSVYKEKMTGFLKDELQLTPDEAFFKEIEKNALYAQNNWYPHIDTDELNKTGIRANALLGRQEEESAAMLAHNNRRSVSASWIVALNISALICGVFLAGLAHERKSNIPEKPNFEIPPFEPPTAASSSQQSGSHGFWNEIFGSEWAALASVSILLLGMAISVGYGVMQHREGTKVLQRIREEKDACKTSQTNTPRNN